jgi:hypothetical protein
MCTEKAGIRLVHDSEVVTPFASHELHFPALSLPIAAGTSDRIASDTSGIIPGEQKKTALTRKDHPPI